MLEAAGEVQGPMRETGSVERKGERTHPVTVIGLKSRPDPARYWPVMVPIIDHSFRMFFSILCFIHKSNRNPPRLADKPQSSDVLIGLESRVQTWYQLVKPG